MTTEHFIRTYAGHLRKAQEWQAEADRLRDLIAKRLMKEGNFDNGSRATRYTVREARVRGHYRRGFSAVRITV